MRKKIFLAAIAAVAMTSCSNDEIVENGAQSAIGFNALTSNIATTRATPVNGANLKDNPFEVYAFTADGKPFMGNHFSTSPYDMSSGIVIAHDGTGWDYQNPADLAYWPTQSLNFYAFHPVADPSMFFTYEVSSDSKQIIRYMIPTKPQYQTDVMYAINRGATKNSHAGKAKLQFHHTLSQVFFKAKTELESMSVDIKSIDVRNCGFSGVLTLPTEGEAITAENWEVSSNTDGQSDFGVFPVAMDGDLLNIGVTAKQVTATSDVQMFLPQTLKRWNPESGSTIIQANQSGESYLAIACKIRQNDVYLHGSESEYKYLYVPFGVQWEPGKRYTYTLVFGGGYDENGNIILAPIDFIPEVDEWQDTPTDVDTDNNLDIK